MPTPASRPDGAPLPPHAVRKLENRSWRLKTSWWILPPLVSLGVLGWVGFVWAGFKTARVKYYVSGGAWLVFSSLVVLLPAGWWTGVIGIVSWFGAAIQAVIMNRTYLVERALRDL
ncbi:hypothetical protein QQX13_09305 [Demequina sp. SYSU T00068]|uniref:hypothetical protein n=1 Tax=Demequina lignilytica TaxID=3051663 RepID=UPI00261E2858|nr:hypothetical protein [Demequina sp. SYSU T00068]MDN4491025.1 hypothetical protein [Demequina sp. SYSU T00068]